MLPLHSYLVLALFAALGIFFILQILWLKQNSGEVAGIPSIDRFYFVAGKVAILTTWVLFVLKAVSPGTGYIRFPDNVSWFAVVVLAVGASLLVASALSLGSSMRSGLPRTSTALKTRGIYRISRNPMYLGLHLIALASCIYFPDLINVSFTIYGIYIHHKIIRHEEFFLQERFGAEWLIYSARVSRYL